MTTYPFLRYSTKNPAQARINDRSLITRNQVMASFVLATLEEMKKTEILYGYV